MIRRLGVLLATVVLVGGLSTASVSAQTAAVPVAAQADAVSVARALIAAENAHNVPLALSYFAPGAIVILPTGVLASPAEIEGWQRELAAGNFRADITTPVAVTPAIVTFSGNVSLDLFRSLGLSSLDAIWELTTALGQITTFNFNFTPAAGARLGAALAGGAPAAAQGIGGTGGTAPPATAAAGRSLALTGSDLDLAAGAAGALVLGFVLVLATTDRRRRRSDGAVHAG